MKQNITIKLVGREFPFEVDSSDEEIIRAAAAKLNDEVKELQFNYQGHDEKDVMCMVMLSEEIRLMELERNGNTEHSDTRRRLEELDAALEDYLHSR